MNWKGCLLILILSITGFNLFGQDQSRRIKVEADGYFENGKYKEAYQYLQKYVQLKPNDIEARKQLGICHYHINNLAKAENFLRYVTANSKSPDLEAIFHLAATYHAKLQFKDAVRYYKLYLKESKEGDIRRNGIKDKIRRCATGLKVKTLDELAIVENLGDKVNSYGDDFAPIISPNFDSKIYFSSSRPGSVGGLRNDQGITDNRYGKYSSDMYSSVVINGEWTATSPLSAVLNTARNEVILDFNPEGGVMFFYKGNSLAKGEIMTDTFNTESQNAFPSKFVSPMRPENGDSYPFFFKDTILVFSGIRNGGYGGLDLYITTFSNGVWSNPQNLGPEINSAYDEISPFLAKDGRTIYFSSNSTKSIGGYDVFKSKYDDIKMKWAPIENLAIPINSAGDDAYFRLSKDGLKAYYSSSRKEGLGKRDIYVAYFKALLNEQRGVSNPIVFTEVPAHRRKQTEGGLVMETPNGQGTVRTTNVPVFPEEEIIEYSFEPAYYSASDEVLTPSNVKTLNRVVKLMKEYPQIKLLLTSHSDEADPETFRLYFSIKRAEQLAGYLSDNGVIGNRIFLRGCGSNYPAARLKTEAGINSPAKKLNRRIELEFYNTAGLPIRTLVERKDIPESVKSSMADSYLQDVKGLSYKVQVAAIKQMYNSPILFRYPNPIVESSGANPVYRYTLGLFQTYYSAVQLKRELEKQGVTSAFVIPYINGVPATRDDTKIYAAAYPDLLNFIEATE